MKVADVLQALQTFFLDFIGAVIPGSILLVGSALAVGALDELASILSKLEDFSWIALLIASYTLGNIAVGVGLFATTRQREAVETSLLRHPAVAAFQQGVPHRVALARDNAVDKKALLHTLRNLALSVTEKGTALTHRFMFIALFHLGTAAAVTISVVTFWVSVLVRGVHPEWSLVALDWWAAIISSVVAILVVVLLFLRWKEFHGRSMRLPFSTALAHHIALDRDSNQVSNAVEPSSLHSLVAPVYLAGGFRSGWQDTVMERMSHLSFFDPRSHGYEDEQQYTAWDLQAIRQSATIFAYAEASNPGLYALALEIGYAKALGKQIILVEQHPDEQRSRYFGMLRACADVRVTSLDEGINFLLGPTSAKLQPSGSTTLGSPPVSQSETVNTEKDVGT